MTTKYSPFFADPMPFLRNIPGGESEANLFNLLREQLPDDWMFVYNASVYGQERENQIDFLVIVPGHGVMNIECKGHNYVPVGTNGQFFNTDDPKRQARFPLQQAERAIINFATDSNERGYNIGYFSYIVVFPDDSFPGVDFEGPIYTSRDRNNLKEIIIREFEVTKQRVQVLRTFTKEDAEKLFNRYSQVYKAKPYQENYDLTYMGQLMQASLNIQQINVLTQVKCYRDTRVLGAAGTGKTLIASYIAHDYAQKGKRILYVCYNLNLACELSIKLSDDPLITVCNYHQIPQLLWGQNLCRFINNEFDDEATDRFFLEYSAINLIPNARKWDILLIDEAQDLNRVKIDFLLGLVKRDNESKVVLFADKNQFIYNQNQDHWILDPLRGQDNENTIELPINMRNPREVHQYCARLVNDDLTQSSDSLNGPRIVQIQKTRDDFKNWLDNDLIKQYAVKASELAILSDERQLLDNVLPYNLRLDNSHYSFRGSNVNSSKDEIISKLQTWHQTNGSHPWKGTIHSFKGLEADYIVIITRCQGNMTTLLHYVGASRPKYLLAIVQIIDG